MKNTKIYGIVTGSYWVFMLSDGALRMIVLLFFHKMGYSPITLAFLFLLYEFFGIVTNWAGSWIAHKFGLNLVLKWGLFIQPLALLALSFLNPQWPMTIAVPFIIAIQAFSGISKDLTKMSAKTSIKFLVPKDQSSSLFKWVAFLTGSKNAIKGAGFFVGGFLLETQGFSHALRILSTMVFSAFVFAYLFLKEDFSHVKSKGNFKKLFHQSIEIKLLSAARVFLFGARDIWFVVAIPLFFSSILKWDFSQVGTFMAIWVIAYGFVQAIAPSILKKWTGGRAPNGKVILSLSVLLSLLMLAISTLYSLNFRPTETIIVGLLAFGLFFALNSSVHSFLIIHLSVDDKAAINVGFYYMANAMGRLIGTLLSGILFQLGGIEFSLFGSAAFLLLSSIFTAVLSHKIIE